MLRDIAAPDEGVAEERAWELVRAAYAAREPSPRRARRGGVAALATALVVSAAAVASPPGRALVADVREAIGVERAAPALFRLPARGRLLVASEAGAWLVHADGSRRLLGSQWREASWSPGGRFVVAAREAELAALEPDGDVRWKLARVGVRHPRWGGGRFDTRIAYRSRGNLRVVGGDGRGDHVLARGARAVPAAWQPATYHFVAFVDSRGRVALADADSSRVFWARDVGDAVQALEWSRGGELLLVRRARSLVVLGFGGRVRHAFLEQSGAAPVTAAAWAPSGRSLAFAQKAGRGSSLWVIPRLAPDAAAARRVFRGAGDFSYLAWSPDGRWLLVGWRDADQWLFIRSARVRRIEAVSRIAAQFDSARFPTVAGWCCG